MKRNEIMATISAFVKTVIVKDRPVPVTFFCEMSDDEKRRGLEC